MESPKTVHDDQTPDRDDAAPSTDGGDNGNDDSGELSVDEWLAEAGEPIAPKASATASDDDGDARLSDIMAELLAAAEQSDDERQRAESAEHGDESAEQRVKARRADLIDSSAAFETTGRRTRRRRRRQGGGPRTTAPDQTDSAGAGPTVTIGARPAADATTSGDATTPDPPTKPTTGRRAKAAGPATAAAAPTADADTAARSDRAEADHGTSSPSDKAAGDGPPAPTEADKADKAVPAPPEPPTQPKPEPAAQPAAEPTGQLSPPRAVPRRSRSTVATFLLAVVGTIVLLYGLLAAAWGIDMARHRDRAMRGVQLATVDVGGQDRAGLESAVDTLTDDLGAEAITVNVGDVDVATDPVTLGARFDGDRMIDEALKARRGGFLLARPFTWLGTLFSEHRIAPRYTVDTDQAAEAAESVIAVELDQPDEPTMELVGTRFVVTPGSPGAMIEQREIVGRLPAAIEAGPPYELELIPRDADPTLPDEAIQSVADELNRQTDQPIAIQVLDDMVEISPGMQRSWVELVIDGDQAEWTIDESLALEDLKPLFPTLGSEDQQAHITVVGGEPIIVPAAESVICCDEGSGSKLATTIAEPVLEPVVEVDDDGEPIEGGEEVQPLRTITLSPVTTGFDEGVAELESLGIVELVSTFTTNHQCCQNRVENIQRFADLTQGVIIRPGEEFSLNGHVGRRTIEKGFVADGAIVQGNFEPQVGGGISQYATTFFNASFFAGIEFLEYQSHSIYISRYPRGREATISWRRPDLRVKNNTDYGILIWNDYTPTSITVSFYSTRHLAVEALPLRRSSDRQCRIDITPRLITTADGSQSEDTVFGLYRPGEGLDCNGNSTTPEEEEEPPPPEPAEAESPEPEPETEPEPGGGEVLP